MSKQSFKGFKLKIKQKVLKLVNYFIYIKEIKDDFNHF